MDILLWILVALVLPAAFCFREMGNRWFAPCERALAAGASRPGMALALIGLLSLVTSIGLTLLTRLPQPGIHDEFSYLLAADTFAHGRMANPPHPLWVHFESIHIIQQPTYASKYPPGQGLALAAGQVLGGDPIVGVWLSTALACMTIYWMLRAWLPARWALLGGLLNPLNPLVLTWSQCYWGGAVAMAGGALLLGAFRRIVTQPKTRDAVLLGIGVALLAISRPFEGMILSLLVATALLVWMFNRHSPPARLIFRKLVLPTTAILALAGALIAGYNFRVTGDPLKLPYSVHEATYGITPNFVWQQPRTEPAYRHSVIRDFQIEWTFSFYRRQQSIRGFAFDCGRKMFTLGRWYFWGFVMVIPVLLTGRAAREDRWLRFTLLLGLLFTASLFPVTWTLQSHYAAPVAGLFCILTLQSLRHLHAGQWRGQPIGKSLVRGFMVICAAATLLFAGRPSRFSTGNFERARRLAEFKQLPGPHLVVVRYSPTHDLHDEWVYNEADIDGAKVVWAREMSPAQNRKLLDYFKSRKVWLLEPDVKPLRITPYP